MILNVNVIFINKFYKMSEQKKTPLSKVSTFRLTTDAFLMLKILSMKHKKSMSRIIDSLIREMFEKEDSTPRSINEKLKDIVKDVLEKSV